MKKYTHLGRTILLLSAPLLAWPTMPLSYGQTPADAVATQSPAAPLPPAPEKKIPVETVKADKSEEHPDEEVLVLSPFEVSTDNKGYYSSSTQSGTRFKTKLEEIGSSISVMNKEQMADFGMLDINDVFMYVGNAEGTSTYTDYTVDRNGLATDNVQLNPNSANRIRGIGSANISYGNFEVSGRMSIDPFIIEALEISRGPNANVFGLGNAAGTVNMVPISANTSRNRIHTEIRFDDLGGYRAGVDVNEVLLKNKLALRASYLRQTDEFTRKPSGMNTTRYNVMVKAQPFKYTTISASAISYESHGNRPNFTPPRDYVSYWQANGKVGWDPVGRRYTQNGVTYGMATATSTTPVAGGTFPILNDNLIPDSIFKNGTGTQRSNLFIEPGAGITLWSSPNGNTPPTGTAIPTPTAGFDNIYYMFSAPGYGINASNGNNGRGNQPLWSTIPVVSDKSIYDWSSINMASANRSDYQTKMYMGQLEQILINNDHQQLAVQLAALREENESFDRTPLGNAGNSGMTGQLFIDVNTRNIDGSPNPYFGRPFIGVGEPKFKDNPSTWDTYRAQASYKLDFSHDQGLSKWLGVQQLFGYYEYKYRVDRTYYYRDVLTSSHPWTALGQNGFNGNQARGNQSSVTNGPQAGANIIRTFNRYYVGDANGGNVDYAPGDYSLGNYNFVWVNAANLSTTNTTAAITNRTEPATLGEVATTDGSGGPSNFKKTIKTPGFVWQGQFLKGKLIAMYGLRYDEVYTKLGVQPQMLTSPDWTTFDYSLIDRWAVGDYRYNRGKTETVNLIGSPFRDMESVRHNAQNGTGVSRFFGELLQGLTLTYNKSNNFVPQPPAFDVFQKALPDTTGKGKDFGLWLHFMQNRLVIRFNHYENSQQNYRDPDASTLIQRMLRLEIGGIATDNYNLHDRVAYWLSQTNPAFLANGPVPVRGVVGSDAQEDLIAQVTKISKEDAAGLRSINAAGLFATTSDIEAKGNELEINFNLNKYWTVAASAEEKSSLNRNYSQSLQQWIDMRMPILTTIVDPIGPGATLSTPNNTTADDNQLWWNNAGYISATTGTAAQNYSGNVNAPYTLIKEQEGKSRPSIRRYSGRISTSYDLAGITSNRVMKNFKVGGAFRWEDKGAIGYYAKGYSPDNPISYIYTALDPDRPIYDEAHAYFDAFISYRMKLWHDKVKATFQLNCRNIQENGRLQPIGAFPDGTIHTYRIVDPRMFVFSATFDL